MTWNWLSILQGIVTAVVLAIIFGAVKALQRLQALETKVDPLLEWWRKTSIDALKIATNPTSERLTELADRYIADVNGGLKMPAREKQELIDGLREVMNDKHQYADKRQSASLSLRFIESREGLVSKAANTNH